MPEKIIKKIINTDENASDNDVSSNEDHNDHEFAHSNIDNRRFLNWFIANFFAGFLLSVVFMVLLVRNQSKFAVITSSNQLETPVNFPIPTSFFSIENKNYWLNQLKFSIDPSITHAKDRALIQTYIKQQKRILAAMPLSGAEKMTLSKLQFVGWRRQ
ncbi:MAG: hypothetical protein RLY40_579 [Pseudomonadota bacterium]|jgi:hypothetical protein